MAGEPTDRRFWTVVFLASVDFCCILLATERYDKGDIKIGTVWLIAGVIFSLTGWKWPQIKRAIARLRKKPSKLKINWANYRAVENGGEVFEVGEFLQQIISGDSLVFDIENHNFKTGGKDYAPRDPLTSKEKRLQVNYSYGSEPARTTEQREHGRLLLPEDSKIKWLTGEVDRLKAESANWRKQYLAENQQRTHYQQEYANEGNRAARVESKVKELEAQLPKPSQYPIPELRLKILSLVSELQGFLGEHGAEPIQLDVHKEPGESNDDFLIRYRARAADEAPLKWRAKFIGDYCQRFGEVLPKLRDEIRVKAQQDSSFLNIAIEKAANNVNAKVATVEQLIKIIWEIALTINV